VPRRIAQALAPLAIGLLIDPLGRAVVVVTACLSLSALIAMLVLKPRVEPLGAEAAAE